MAKILVVDDNEDLSDFFCILLSQYNHIVKTARSGKELFDAMKIFTPDIILLDVLLAGEDGRKISKQIKQTNSNIKIVLLSANPLLLINHEEAAADDTIEKPFELSVVLLKIENLLRDRKQN